LPGFGQLCAEIKRRLPTLPVLVLSAQVEPVLQAAAAQVGADALGARGMAVAELDRLIRQPLSPPGGGQPRPVPVGTPTQKFGPWLALRRQLRISGIQPMEAVMTALEGEQRRGREVSLV
jgi:CheY-like chemotaxis protein